MNQQHKRHLLYDVWIDRPQLTTVEPWTAILPAAAKAGGGTILHQHFHQFEPDGMTGFLLLAESHISVHTWPEDGIAAIDIFTCGGLDADRVVACLRQHLAPATERLQDIDRST